VLKKNFWPAWLKFPAGANIFLLSSSPTLSWDRRSLQYSKCRESCYSIKEVSAWTLLVLPSLGVLERWSSTYPSKLATQWALVSVIFFLSLLSLVKIYSKVPLGLKFKHKRFENLMGVNV
jgi:hypothetical protein